MAALLHLPWRRRLPRLAVVASPLPFVLLFLQALHPEIPSSGTSAPHRSVRRSTTLIARASPEDGDGDGEEVPENRKRLSIYKGIVMSKQNAGIHTTIRIRRIIMGIGVSVDCFSLFELGKPSYCNLKVVNNTEHHVAFKVKTTSPRKYFVRPNTSVVQPWDSCTITVINSLIFVYSLKVTLQAQTEYPPDMLCNDKFLLQSTKVPPITDVDELQPDTFNKEGDKVIEESEA
ncbi:hypothetical protein J5N97_029656 [Dioscorea zingiberensis]|uniref:MSP domain-containing protein n=1 Tax=Dioscorea zingiberensis TaxID=325984 RepID=A0A9D5BW48_9LILI|nr:hypothetical protein J5N97_029656 [Dioscorea zingiberensis]